MNNLAKKKLQPEAFERVVEDSKKEWVTDRNWTIAIEIDPTTQEIRISCKVPSTADGKNEISDQPRIFKGHSKNTQFKALLFTSELLELMVKRSK